MKRQSLLIVLLILLLPLTLCAADTFPGGRLHMGISGHLGYGQEKPVYALEINTGERWDFSAGGGSGASLDLGVCIIPSLDLGVHLGYAHSGRNVSSNSVATFKRYTGLVDLKYRFPVAEHMRLNVGGGAGYYTDGYLKMEFEERDTIPHSREVITYKDAVGSHALLEWETYVTPRSSLLLGIVAYHVTYEYDTWKYNSQPLSPSQICPSRYDRFAELDGSGIDTRVAYTYYF